MKMVEGSAHCRVCSPPKELLSGLIVIFSSIRVKAVSLFSKMIMKARDQTTH